MPRIAIPQIRDDRKPVEYRIRLDPEVDDQLQLYRKLYTQTYNQQIEAKELLAPIICRFLENDRSFAVFKRQHQKTKTVSNPSGTATSPKTGRADPLAAKP